MYRNDMPTAGARYGSGGSWYSAATARPPSTFRAVGRTVGACDAMLGLYRCQCGYSLLTVILFNDSALTVDVI
jgi:hypothetical protein